MRGLLLFFGLILATTIYLWPGSQAMIQGRTDTVMSDDSDPAPLPYIYDQVVHTWKTHPSRLFYGAVYIENEDPIIGVASWIPWNERWTAVLTSPFVPVEQQSTVFVFIILCANAMAMYLLGRYLKWNRSISSGLALAWAFCCYTRTRAKVHMAMAGIYHLPLVFLGLLLVTRGRSKKSLAAAMLAFLLAATVVHYYLVTAIFLSPFFVLFLVMQPEFRTAWKPVTIRFLIAVAPMLIFLGLNFAFPIPSGLKLTAGNSFPDTGVVKAGTIHPFLTRFAAQPIDFLAGDIAFAQGAKDLNPLREKINESILTNLDGSYPHERANGIRWSLLILAAAALIILVRRKVKSEKAVERNILFFLIFGFFGFLLSLSPEILTDTAWGPSLWINSLISQVRVPSRAGILPHFAILMMVGFLLTSNFWAQKEWRKIFLMPALFPLLMFLDYPPLQQETMSPVRPTYTELKRENGSCGAGMYLPFVNGYFEMHVYYGFLQSMRGSDCGILNGMQSLPHVQYLLDRYPATAEFISKAPSDPQIAESFKKLANCVPLTWVVFDPGFSPAWMAQACAGLGWKLNPDRSCVSPEKGLPMRKLPEECL